MELYASSSNYSSIVALIFHLFHQVSSLSDDDSVLPNRTSPVEVGQHPWSRGVPQALFYAYWTE